MKRKYFTIFNDCLDIIKNCKMDIGLVKYDNIEYLEPTNKDSENTNIIDICLNVDNDCYLTFEIDNKTNLIDNNTKIYLIEEGELTKQFTINEFINKLKK